MGGFIKSDYILHMYTYKIYANIHWKLHCLERILHTKTTESWGKLLTGRFKLLCLHIPIFPEMKNPNKRSKTKKHLTKMPYTINMTLIEFHLYNSYQLFISVDILPSANERVLHLWQFPYNFFALPRTQWPALNRKARSLLEALWSPAPTAKDRPSSMASHGQKKQNIWGIGWESDGSLY